MQWALAEIGEDSDLWSFADFPLGHHASIHIPSSTANPIVTVQGLANPEKYFTSWNRRPCRPEMLSEQLAQEDREMVLYEAHLFIENLKPVLAPNAVWVNPFESRRLVLSKALQLEFAAKAGFKIPETLISNNFDDVRAFIRTHSGSAIYKGFHQAGWTNGKSGEEYRNFTSIISEEDLTDPVSITSCPGIYQQLIRKKAELRVAFFGDACFGMRIHSQQSRLGQLDWRSDVARESQTEAADLNDALVDKCRMFARNSGLLHGSIDLVESESGELVFLEVNEMGQFLWLEDYHPELRLLAGATAFSLDPRADFNPEQQKLPSISMEAYRNSSTYREWLTVWDAYVERKVYPQTYTE